MALLDVGMAILANQASAFLNTGVAPQRQGNSHPSLAPYQDFHTKDGAMLLAIGNNGQFARFCEAAGHADWASDPRFATNTLRVRHREVLIPQMEAVTRTRTTAEWIALLEDKAVPCGPINDIAQAFDDEQVKARGLAVTHAARMPATASTTSSASRARCACRPRRRCCAMRRRRSGSTPTRCWRRWASTTSSAQRCARPGCSEKKVRRLRILFTARIAANSGRDAENGRTISA